MYALKKKVEENEKKWPELILKILFGYNTTKKVSTGYSPFELSHVCEAVLPVEVTEPSYRRLYSDEVNATAFLKASLDLVDEKRAKADVHNMLYKRRVARYYNKKVGPRHLQPGDLVRRKMSAMGLHPGKLGPNWGPIERIRDKAGYGAYHLETLEVTLILRAWSIDNLQFVPHDPEMD